LHQQQLLLQPQQQQQQEGRGEDFVSRWMGSSCASPRSTQQQQHDGMPPPASQSPRRQQGSNRAACAPSKAAAVAAAAVAAEQQQQLPLAAPCGSWQRQFKQQYSYQVLRLCPRCGSSSIIPIVYGFPSTGLLAGMQAKRLVLGGDHLIESCHTWTCGGCRSCFRSYPYVNVQLWLRDDAAQQRQEHARAAAGRGGRGGSGEGAPGAAAGGDGGGGGQQQQQHWAEGVVAGSHSAAEGFPRYTYEL
jgi:hypothetical protein